MKQMESKIEELKNSEKDLKKRCEVKDNIYNKIIMDVHNAC
jgi:hypothetical protein